MSNKILLVVEGPTASGKTALSIQLAKLFQTEIISADSRQFYREMSIGTAVPELEELNQVKHHNIQNISIFDKYDVADYMNDVLLLLEELFQKHDIVVMAGGSTLFVDAVCNGLDEMPMVDAAIRTKIEMMFKTSGIEFLQQEVERLDPAYYSEVDRQNPRRLQRALEVCYQTGKPFSSFRKREKVKRPFKPVKIGILWDRKVLYDRINKRVDEMVNRGLVDEVRSLYPNRDLNALNTVGYKELFEYFDGKLSFEEAIEQIKIDTRHYAKRQMTWLNKDKSIRWFTHDAVDDIACLVKDEMAND